MTRKACWVTREPRPPRRLAPPASIPRADPREAVSRSGGACLPARREPSRGYSCYRVGPSAVAAMRPSRARCEVLA